MVNLALQWMIHYRLIKYIPDIHICGNIIRSGMTLEIGLQVPATILGSLTMRWNRVSQLSQSKWDTLINFKWSIGPIYGE